MGARGRRGLIIGLADLARSTGRIREANEGRARLDLAKRAQQLDERQLQAALDEIDRKNALSQLLSERIAELPGMRERRPAPLARGMVGMQDVPTSEARFLSTLIESVPPGDRVRLYETLIGNAAPTTMMERLFSPDELREMELAQHTRRLREPRVPRAPKTYEETLGEREAALAKRTGEILRTEGGPLADPTKAFITPEAAEKKALTRMGILSQTEVPSVPKTAKVAAVSPAMPNAEAELAADYIDLKGIPRSSLDPNQVIEPTEKGLKLINLFETWQQDPKNPAARKLYFDEYVFFSSDPDDYFQLSD